jgi:tRNA(Ile)-lysidine synthase
MLEQRIHDFFERVCPVQPDDVLLAAVSGGPDSIALLHLLLAARDSLGIRLEVAHLDHGIRGEDGVADARFVSEQAEREGLTLHRRKVDILSLREEEGGSLEAMARRERYRFLDEARAVAGARWIVTGHNANDQVETFLMNLLRGSGPRGLGGMLPTGPGPRCRPLLETWRTEILDYLEANDLPYRDDPSNRDLTWTRNRIRHRLVPLLEDAFSPSVLSVLVRESRLMSTIDEYLTAESNRILRELKPGDADSGGNEIRVDLSRLRDMPAALRQSVLRAAIEDLAGGLEDVTLAHLDAMDAVADRENGSEQVDLPRGLAVRREYGTLVVSQDPEANAKPGAPPSPPLDLSRPGEARWGRSLVRWTLAGAGAVEPREWADAPSRSCFDAGSAVSPVYLRSQRPGDRLEPQGMEGSQKLSDLFINLKVPRHLRTWVPVLCDNGGPEDGERILWVVGHRRSRHGSVGPETAQVVLFEAETIV